MAFKLGRNVIVHRELNNHFHQLFDLIRYDLCFIYLGFYVTLNTVQVIS